MIIVYYYSHPPTIASLHITTILWFTLLFIANTSGITNITVAINNYHYAETARFAHTLLVMGRSTDVLGNIKVPPPLNFTFILHSLKIFNKS